MPIIAWWNVAGVGGENQIVMNTLKHGLFFIQDQSMYGKPDIIILGEVLNDFCNRANEAAPDGYDTVSIQEAPIAYKANSKKFALYKKNRSNVNASLITDPNNSTFSRPGMMIDIFPGTGSPLRIVALHLASISNGTKKQREQMVRSISDCGSNLR